MLGPLLFLTCFTAASAGPADDQAPDYATQVAPIFTKYCAGCHNDDDREGEFSLESYPALLRGTPKRSVLTPGRSDKSRIYGQLTGAAKPAMPPKGEQRPGQKDVELIKRWIDAGAIGPQHEPADRMALAVPRIPASSKAGPVTALDASADGKWLAKARYGAVDLYHTSTDGTIPDGPPARVLGGLPGKVTAVHFGADGSRLVTASGVAGLGGVAAIWNTADGSLVRRFEGHRDLLFDAELSPDGTMLATCGYDRTIRLWSAGDGRSLRSLEGHNGAVYDVAFSPDGRFLVSASADDTCKVWRVEDGMRMDTLPQPLKEEYCCSFSPDGRTIIAAGADNSIRVWEFVSRDKPRINPMLLARYAHEGAVVRLAFSRDGSRLVTTAEDRTVRVWETTGYTELASWGPQSDVAIGLAISGNGNTFLLGRMDGTMERLAFPGLHGRSKIERTRTQKPALPSNETAKTSRAVEREPNDEWTQANELHAPVEVTGTIAGRPGGRADVDLFQFSARTGETWVIEVDAARKGSKLDSFIEVLDSKGHRIERARLQAVRDSYFAFRGKDDNQVGDFRLFNWEEMHLGEYLYANGEVVKLWLYPRGPDSGFVVYPGQGARWGYFDTTPLSHALGEPCYVVQPHPPGTELIPNGLPCFSLYYENDDESHREVGKDSKLEFVAPADGQYLVKISDVRGFEGADFKYTLRIRPARPDFQVTLRPPNSRIVPGGAQEFRVMAKRIDGFEGPIRVEVENLPDGYLVTSPLVIEAGQIEALGVVAAAAKATAPKGEDSKGTRVTARATVAGRAVSHVVGTLGSLKLADKPAPVLKVSHADGGPRPTALGSGRPPEYEIHPGQTIMLKVEVQRNGYSGPVSLGNEGAGRNLPFGVIVDNLGLNGLLITEDQDARTFFITADPSVGPQSRPFHVTTSAAGGQSSQPVILQVR